MMGTRRVSAIVFDFDGTLADTMGDHYRAWAETGAVHGIRIRAEDYFPMEGMTPREIARSFFGSQFDEGAIVAEKDARFVQFAECKFYEGVEHVLDRLAEAGIELGIVTAGLRGRLARSVPAPFLDRFRAIVTGDDVSRGKPDPEPYLLGLARMGRPPDACVVVENAPLGIQSAKRAGCYTIGVCSTVGPDVLSEADEVVPRFSSLLSARAIAPLVAPTDG